MALIFILLTISLFGFLAAGIFKNPLLKKLCLVIFAAFFAMFFVFAFFDVKGMSWGTTDSTMPERIKQEFINQNYGHKDYNISGFFDKSSDELYQLFVHEYINRTDVEKYTKYTETLVYTLDANDNVTYISYRDLNGISNYLFIPAQDEYTDNLTKYDNITFKFWLHRYKNNTYQTRDITIHKARLVYDTVYSVYDDTGHRVTKNNENAADTYLFLGCSFMYGDGVQDFQTLPYKFSKLFSFNAGVTNAARSGLGILMAKFMLENHKKFLKEGQKLKSVIYMYMYDHTYRLFSSGLGCSSYEDDSGVFAYFDKKFYHNSFYKDYLRGRIIAFLGATYYKFKVFYLLKQMDKICLKEYGCRLTVIVWDLCDEDGLSGFQKLLKKIGIDTISVKNHLQNEKQEYIIKDDGHPSAFANEILAQVLYDHLKEQNAI